MIVVAAVIVCDGRVLACQRNAKGEFPLKWEFPGGKIQSGETPESALKRELREELGITAKIGSEIFRARHKYPQMTEAVDLIFFQVRLAAADVHNRIFHDVVWIEPHDLRQLDFLEADRALIEHLVSGNFAC